VRNAGAKLTDSFHLLGMPQLFLEPFASSDVLNDNLDGSNCAVLVVDGEAGAGSPAILPALVHQSEFLIRRWRSGGGLLEGPDPDGVVTPVGDAPRHSGPFGKFARRVAGQFLDFRTGVANATVDPNENDAESRRLHEGSVTGFGTAESAQVMQAEFLGTLQFATAADGEDAA
jgi:hypothetical protein